jgi:hypothetical protein
MKKSLLFILLFCLLGFFNHLKAQNLPVYQYWNSTLHRHFYTTDHNELGNGGNGWVQQGQIGSNQGISAFLWSTGGNGGTGTCGQPVYRFYNTATSAHYYTMNVNVYPNGFHFEGILGYEPGCVVHFVSVYEFYNSGDYYYSTDQTPPTGYKLNGVAFEMGG